MLFFVLVCYGPVQTGSKSGFLGDISLILSGFFPCKIEYHTQAHKDSQTPTDIHRVVHLHKDFYFHQASIAQALASSSSWRRSHNGSQEAACRRRISSSQGLQATTTTTRNKQRWATLIYLLIPEMEESCSPINVMFPPTFAVKERHAPTCGVLLVHFKE